MGLSVALLPPAEISAQSVSTYSRPKSVPERASSNFDASLRCMDELLARSNYGAGIPIYARKLEKEEMVGASTRDMIVSALGRMSERSRLFTIRVDPTAGERKTLAKNALVVGGSITSFDKGVGSNGSGGGVSIGPVGLGFRNQTLDSIISITVFMQDFDGVVLPLTAQNVSMTLKTKSKGGDLSGNVGLLGGFLEMEFSRADGPMQAVRALVDISLIQSVGAWAGVPYQRCLTLPQSDPGAIQLARKTFDRMKHVAQVQKIIDGLVARGLYSGPVSNGVMTQELRQAIADYQLQQQMPPLGLPTFEVYYSMFGDRYGAAGASAVPTIKNARSPNVLGLRVAPFGPNFIAADDGTPLIGTGKRASFTVTAVRPSHVTCFYTDALNRTNRIFPNPQRPGDVLLPNENLILPGPKDIYTIEPEKVGAVEFITCAASSQPITTAMLGNLGKDLAPGASRLPVDDVDALTTRLQRVNADQLSVYTLQFQAMCLDMSGDGQLHLECPTAGADASPPADTAAKSAP
jgi:hypothetical protein